MNKIISDVIAIVVGCLMVIFHKSFARLIIEQQNKFWGFHFGDREVKISGIISIIAGTGMIVLSLLSLLKIIPFK